MQARCSGLSFYMIDEGSKAGAFCLCMPTEGLEDEMKKKKRQRWAYLFSAPFLIAYALFMVYPMIHSFWLSLYSYDGFMTKTYIGFKNYVTMFKRDPLFLKSIGNTFIITLMSLPVNLIGGLLLAYLLYRLTRGRRFFQVSLFLPYITTPVAIGFIFSYIFGWNSGILNQVLVKLGVLQDNYFWLQNVWSARMIVAFMIVWRNLGYCLMIYLAGMTSIDQDLCEAAEVDGASKWQSFRLIIVPLLRNVTSFLLLTSIIGALQMFDEPSQLYSGWAAASRSIGGPSHSVLTVIWKFYDDSFGSNTRLGYGAAISYCLFLIIGICTFLVNHLLNRGQKEDRTHKGRHTQGPSGSRTGKGGIS